MVQTLLRLGDDRVHRSHREVLLGTLPEHAPAFPDDAPGTAYVWPV
ncbi:hypothetical protein [Pseudonocardia pini]|nr:hypothetical protein [Pseudonocardia pini]